MGDEDHGQLEPFAHLGEQLQHLGLHRHVEGRDRLVGHQQFGLHGQGAGDADALALAAGKLVRETVEGFRAQAHQLQQLGSAFQGLCLGHALGDGALCDGRADAVARVERSVRVLEDHLDLAARLGAELGAVGRQDLALEHDAAAVERCQSDHAATHGRLARARLADDAQRLSAAQLEVEPVAGVHLAAGLEQAAAGDVGLVQVLHLQHEGFFAGLFRLAHGALRNGGNQLSCIGVSRVAQHLGGGAGLDHHTGLHHHHLVGDLGHHTEVVGDEQHGRALAFLQVLDEFQDLRLGGHVERGGGFVADQQGGFHGQCAGDDDPLALAAGQAEGVAVDQHFRLGQADVGQRRDDALAFFGGAQTDVGVEHLGDLVADAHHRVQRRHRLLEHHADTPAAQGAQLVFVELQQVLAVEQNAAGHRFDMRPGQQSHDGVGDHRLAGTGLADHTQGLAGQQRQGGALDGQFAVGALGQADVQAGDFEHGIGWVQGVHLSGPFRRNAR